MTAPEPAERDGNQVLREAADYFRNAVADLDALLVRSHGDDWFRSNKHVVRYDALRKAYGDLSTAWINVTWELLRDPAVEPWSVEPLLTRSREAGYDWTVWEYGPDRNMAISDITDADRTERDLGA